MKQCSLCQVYKREEDFHNASQNKDGKNSRCKECRSEAGDPQRAERNRAWAEANAGKNKTRSEASRKRWDNWPAEKQKEHMDMMRAAKKEKRNEAKFR